MGQEMNNQDRSVLIQGFADQVEKHRSEIEALSKDAVHVSATSRPSILLLMTAAFKDFKIIADLVAGDYDSRARQAPDSKAIIPATLSSNLEDAFAQSLSASERVRSDLLKVCGKNGTLNISSIHADLCVGPRHPHPARRIRKTDPRCPIANKLRENRA